MSSEACLVFFGVRYEPSESELEALEMRRHPLMIAARKAGLRHYWANFGFGEEKYYVFVGAQIGIIGAEIVAEVGIPSEAFRTMIEETTAKLREANVPGTPMLWLQLLST